jgi:hypothetical protein
MLNTNFNQISSLKFYPNPANDRVKVIVNGQLRNPEVTAYNINGKKIILNELNGDANSIVLDIGPLSAGTWILSIREDHIVYSGILVKE